MSPGTYLRKRREAAGLPRWAVAGFLVGRQAHRLRVKIGPVSPHIGRMEREIAACENDSPPFDADMAGILHECFPFDLAIYRQLLLIHSGADCSEPRICRECACSWNDACRPSCAWSETDPTICTACEARAAAKGDNP